MKKKWFTVKEIFPNMWAIAEFGHFEKVISYLFVGEEKALLFDTGMGIGNIEEEVFSITKLPVSVLNSHCHFDHIGGNYLFENILQFKNEWCEKISKNGYLTEELQDYVSSDKFFIHLPRGFKSNSYKIKPFQIKQAIKEEDIIVVDPFEFRVIISPGHTPDSICLYEKYSGLLLTGDTIYPGPIYINLKESSLDTYMRSIKKLISIKNVKGILPGHNNFIQNVNIIKKISETLSVVDKLNLNQIIKIDDLTSLVVQ